MDNQKFDPETETIFHIFIYTVIILIALAVITGNFLVILAIIVQKSLRTPPNIYLGSLAVIDLCVGIFILPIRISLVMNFNNWKFGGTLCGAFITMDITLCTLSIYHLIAIAIDRYRAITQGVRYVQRRSFATVSITIAFLVVVSLWISTPPVLGWHNGDWGLQFEEDSDNIYCIMTRDQGYVFHSALGTFLLPMAIVIFLYFKIYKEIKIKLRKKSRPASMHLQTTNKRSEGPSCSSEDVLEKNAATQGNTKSLNKRIKFQLTRLKIRSILPTTSSPPSSISPETMAEQHVKVDLNSKGTLEISHNKSVTIQDESPSQVEQFVTKKIKFSLSKERRAAKTLGLIIGAFVICWLPFCVLYLVDAFITPLTYSVWFEASSWMGYFNSALNPIIYTFFNKEFRSTFTKILCFWKSKSVQIR